MRPPHLLRNGWRRCLLLAFWLFAFPLFCWFPPHKYSLYHIPAVSRLGKFLFSSRVYGSTRDHKMSRCDMNETSCSAWIVKAGCLKQYCALYAYTSRFFKIVWGNIDTSVFFVGFLNDEVSLLDFIAKNMFPLLSNGQNLSSSCSFCNLLCMKLAIFYGI